MRFIVLFAVLALTACAPMYSTSYHLTAPQTAEGRLCANQCLDKKDSCLRHCSRDEKDCRRLKTMEAYAEYMVYAAQQDRQGLPIDKTKSDFEDYSSCEDTDCTDMCESSHRQCHVNCGGEIIEEKTCIAYCED